VSAIAPTPSKDPTDPPRASTTNEPEELGIGTAAAVLNSSRGGVERESTVCAATSQASVVAAVNINMGILIGVIVVFLIRATGVQNCCSHEIHGNAAEPHGSLLGIEAGPRSVN
jgi:hypothetical protein